MKFFGLFRAYRYEIIAFLTGAAVMILEIVGARLIAPQFGTSTYVWTAMIGVILIALAVGFTVGGRLADRYHSQRFLSMVLLLAAMLVLITGLLQAVVLSTLASWHLDLRLGALLAALLLFAPPSLLIGMVSPHLAKIRITSLESTGRSIGRLEAAGAFGSIAGTFLCGYFLLGLLGSRSIIVGIVILLLITSFIANPRQWSKVQLYGLAAAVFLWPIITANPPSVLADVDTPYARYTVTTRYFFNQPIRMLLADTGGIQSAVPSSGANNLILAYVREFYSASLAYRDPKNVLVIGGGAYTFPVALIKQFPNVHVDVAEIDKGLDSLAQKYFYYQESPRLTIYHDDGRSYLNTTHAKYDMIYMDAFSSQSPPFQLTTQEAVRHIADNLTTDGVVVVNLISTYRSGNDPYLRAVLATYGTSFRNAALYQTVRGTALDVPQNFQLLASNNDEKFAALSANMERSPLALQAGGLVLTDNYAPIERLTYY